MKLIFENWREYLNENSRAMSADEWIDFMENEFEESEAVTHDVFKNYLSSRISANRTMPSIEEVRKWYYGLKSLLDPEDRSHVPQYEGESDETPT